MKLSGLTSLATWLTERFWGKAVAKTPAQTQRVTYHVDKGILVPGGEHHDGGPTRGRSGLLFSDLSLTDTTEHGWTVGRFSRLMGPRPIVMNFLKRFADASSPHLNTVNVGLFATGDVGLPVDAWIPLLGFVIDPRDLTFEAGGMVVAEDVTFRAVNRVLLVRHGEDGLCYTLDDDRLRRE